MAMDAAKKEALQKKIVIGLALVLCGSFVYNFLSASSGSGKVSVSEAANQAANTDSKIHIGGSLQETLQKMHDRMIPQMDSEAPLTISPEEEERRKPKYTAQELRDPFENILTRPAQSQAATALGATYSDTSGGTEAEPAVEGFPAITIQGIVWGGQKPLAVIDNVLYKVGDTINGATITAIDRVGVTVTHGTATVVLTVPRTGAVKTSL